MRSRRQAARRALCVHASKTGSVHILALPVPGGVTLGESLSHLISRPGCSAQVAVRALRLSGT